MALGLRLQSPFDQVLAITTEVTLCRRSTQSDKRRPYFTAGYLETGTIMRAPPTTLSPLSELHVWNIWGDFIRCVVFLEEAVCLGDSLNGALSRGR